MSNRETLNIPALGSHGVAGFDYGYYPTPHAHIYTSVHLTGKLTTRFYVSIPIAPSSHSFEIHSATKSTAYNAAVLKPLTPSGKRITHGPLLTVHLVPTHPHFRRFQVLPRPGIVALDRALFEPMDAEINDACQGRLSLEDSQQLIDRIVKVVIALFPKPKPPDERVVKLCDLLRLEPGISLPDIASALNLSYDRTSHVFTEAIGLPFRSYQLWLKVRRANRLLWMGESLTEAAHSAGFADSAHLCRTYQQVFGRPPSYFFDGRHVKIFAPISPAVAASVAPVTRTAAATAQLR